LISTTLATIHLTNDAEGVAEFEKRIVSSLNIAGLSSAAIIRSRDPRAAV
jgi:hypothetical protein